MSKSQNCLFCQPEIIEDGLLGETENFYIRAAMKGSLAPGHILLISKSHLSCFGAMPESLDFEYTAFLERIKEVESEEFSEPILVEQGIHGQSVPHAHTHFIPSVSREVGYDFSENKGLISHIPSGIRYQAGPEMGICDVRRIFNQDGQYATIEEQGILCICRTLGYKGKFGLARKFIAEATGRHELLDWQTMTEKQQEENQSRIDRTLNTFNGRF